jgi:hypothetical protein
MPCLYVVQYTEYMDLKMYGIENFKTIDVHLYNFFIIRGKIYKYDPGNFL